MPSGFFLLILKQTKSKKKAGKKNPSPTHKTKKLPPNHQFSFKAENIRPLLKAYQGRNTIAG